MGSSQSSVLLPAPSSTVPLFALTFRRPDTITLILASDNVIDVITRVCMKLWKRGFEYVGRQEDNSFQLIFKGSPFLIGERREDAQSIKLVCAQLLIALYSNGYELVLCSDVSRYNDYTTWFFEQQSPIHTGPAPSICCLSLSSTDSLQLINGNEMLKHALRKTVIDSYGPGIQDERDYVDPEVEGSYCYELILCGSPWHTTSTDLSVSAQKLILSIFRAFYNRNFRYYGRANFKGTADSIFFMYDSDIDSTDIDFCLISLNGNNRLRLVDCPRDIADQTMPAIEQYWTYGLQGHNVLSDGVQEYVMGGYPWWASNSDAVASREFVTILFETLLPLGWRIVCSLDISRRVNDKSIFILQSRSPRSMRHFCLSFNDTDKIRIIRARPDMAIRIEKLIIGNWPRGIQREIDYYRCREIKLRGTPFEPLTQNEGNMIRVLMCYMLNLLHANGCRVVASGDISAKFHQRGSSGSNYPFDVHSWFIVGKD